MMNIKCPSLYLVTERTCTCTGVTFAPQGQSYLVGWSEIQDPSRSSYDVYSLNSQLMTSFEDSRDSCDPTWALLADNRVAIAQISSFRVWDLSSGQMLATVGPNTTPASYSWEGGGQVATSPSGSKAAFCPAVALMSSPKIYFYDAATLQLQACLKAEEGAESLDSGTHSSRTSGLFWSLHGWMLAYKPPWLQPLGYGHGYGHLQLMASQADVHAHAVMQGCEPRCNPALSPCASFVVLFSQQRASLEIRDVHSGKLLLSHAVRLAKRHTHTHTQRKIDLTYDFSLRWSSCGSRVIARVTAVVDQHLASERIVALQLF